MKNIGLILGVALAVVAAAVPAFGTPYMMGVVFQVAMWIALAQSWSMLSATTGYLSLGHAVFYGVGAYVCVLLTGTIPFEWALLAGAAAYLPVRTWASRPGPGRPPSLRRLSGCRSCGCAGPISSS